MILLFNINASFSYYDEWMNWGPFIKDMYFRNKFYNTEGHFAFMHISYQPFISIFNYFYLKTVGMFSEPNMYRGHQLLCYSISIAVFSKLLFDTIKSKKIT